VHPRRASHAETLETSRSPKRSLLTPPVQPDDEYVAEFAPMPQQPPSSAFASVGIPIPLGTAAESDPREASRSESDLPSFGSSITSRQRDAAEAGGQAQMRRGSRSQPSPAASMPTSRPSRGLTILSQSPGNRLVWQRIGAFAFSVCDLLALSQCSRGLRRSTLHVCIDESQRRRLCDAHLKEFRRVSPAALASSFFGAASVGGGGDMPVDNFRLAKVTGHLLTGCPMASVIECEDAISGDRSLDHHASVVARFETMCEFEAREPGSYVKPETKRLLARLLARVDAAALSPVLQPLYRLLCAILEVVGPGSDADDVTERCVAGALLRLPWAFPL
jgi:hypothetical protein